MLKNTKKDIPKYYLLYSFISWIFSIISYYFIIIPDKFQNNSNPLIQQPYYQITPISPLFIPIHFL